MPWNEFWRVLEAWGSKRHMRMCVVRQTENNTIFGARWEGRNDGGGAVVGWWWLVLQTLGPPPPLFFLLLASDVAHRLRGVSVRHATRAVEEWTGGGLGDRELAILPSFLLRNRAWDDDGCSLRDGPGRGGELPKCRGRGGKRCRVGQHGSSCGGGGLFVMALLFGLAAAHLQHIRSSVEASCHSSMSVSSVQD